MLLWKEGGTSCRGARFASLALAGAAEKRGARPVAAHRSALPTLALRWPSRFSCSSGRSFPRFGAACRCCSRFGRPLLRIAFQTASLLSQASAPRGSGPRPTTESGAGNIAGNGVRQGAFHADRATAPRSRTMRRLQRPRTLPFPFGGSSILGCARCFTGWPRTTCGNVSPRWEARTPGNAGPSHSETVIRRPARRPARTPGPARARNGLRAARTPRRRGR